ncbi:beta-ketoacyl synthase N-terminal-like domain-containing protein [Cellulomonas edaphi]|uniref:Beta-ketoacyl synthase N-terminal-like domain-containing protein n=1 Tax=Cellulomonas edaphi TaxID=3053468 RepID=A0ABT7S4S5_9CELL|nr:beta-ketoacyl synthase N-terminal-like domain-containing protein [Cellulomons edaphi]MDM7830624.1 beta-ketoacyl synthase N-terminal-like domain-containing protein [Cellulomons edaphi]
MTAVVSGYGAITALGAADDTWAGVLAGATAARSWEDLADEGFPVTTACRVTSLPPGDPVRRGRDLASAALADALAMAPGALPGVPSDRVGVYVGTTMGESAGYERATTAFAADEHNGAALARHVAGVVGATGPVRAYGTACAAGNYAIGAAAAAVRAGRVDVAIAGGVEPFSRIAMVGFARMRAMTPDLCRPFVAGRRGMQLGEGAAFVVITSAARAGQARAVVGALGLASDAHHPTSPRADGSGMAAAMRSALSRSGVPADDVDWVCAHGTGTPQSDAAEAAALRTEFPAGVPVSSIKGAIGHTMGAASAVETVIAVRALEAGVVPPNVNGPSADPGLGLDVVAAPRPGDVRWVLNCAYAFGGLDSALVLGRAA